MDVILHNVPYSLQVLYKLSAVLSASAVFSDCSSAINDVITRSQQVWTPTCCANLQTLPKALDYVCSEELSRIIAFQEVGPQAFCFYR